MAPVTTAVLDPGVSPQLVLGLFRTVLECRSGCLTERNRRDASSARSEEGAYREYVTDERRSDAKQIGDFATEGNPFGVLVLGFF
jgi:hypothetical protein